MFWFGDMTFMLLIPAILFSLYAQWKVTSAFKKYSAVPTRSGMTGAQVAQAILSGHGTLAGVEAGKTALVHGIAGVQVAQVGGQLSDHYDPSAKVLRLSEPVYGSSSIAAVSVAAHEAGHAVQHAVHYPFLGLRSMAVPMANIGSQLAFPLIFLGMIIPSFFPHAINLAILLYLGVVAFTVVTLPVEFNASRRALAILHQGGYLTQDELPGARAVLNAAALTYVASALSAVLMLVRLLIMRGLLGSRDE